MGEHDKFLVWWDAISCGVTFWAGWLTISAVEFPKLIFVAIVLWIIAVFMIGCREGWWFN